MPLWNERSLEFTSTVYLKEKLITFDLTGVKINSINSIQTNKQTLKIQIKGALFGYFILKSSKSTI